MRFILLHIKLVARSLGALPLWATVAWLCLVILGAPPLATGAQVWAEASVALAIFVVIIVSSLSVSIYGDHHRGACSGPAGPAAAVLLTLGFALFGVAVCWLLGVLTHGETLHLTASLAIPLICLPTMLTMVALSRHLAHRGEVLASGILVLILQLAIFAPGLGLDSRHYQTLGLEWLGLLFLLILPAQKGTS